MTYRIVSEQEFRQKLNETLVEHANYLKRFRCVTGPGRSGAVAAVYTSHQLGIPFIPYGQHPPELDPVLVVDTATWTGRTMRKAARKYGVDTWLAVYKEGPGAMVKFWYEGQQ